MENQLINIIEKLPKEILIHCVEILVFKKTTSTNMSTIDITNIPNPSSGSFIIKTDSKTGPIKAGAIIAAFDLDHTLIKPKSGNKFPKDSNDWVLLDGVKKKLTDLYTKDYKIVIFTNQASSSFDITEFEKKIKAISTLLDLPLQLFGCTDYGYCRKPSVGMWWLLTQNNENIPIDMEKSFYVGDAAGRKGDFSDSDLKFALNIGLRFYADITDITDNLRTKSFPKPVHPLELATNFDKYLDQDNIERVDKQEMIILVGPPASGKSVFAKSPIFVDYVIACQDDLKTKPKVINVVKKALKDGKSVIIDRKNEYIVDRAEFIQLAADADISVRIIWFDVHRDLSEHLATYREIMTGKHIPAIVFNKYYSKEKGLQIPTIEEGAEVIKVFFKKDIKKIDNPVVFNSYLV